ncbi:unnamed protein product [Boreogadus saida]
MSRRIYTRLILALRSFKSPDGMENEIHQPFTYLLRSLPDSAVLGSEPEVEAAEWQVSFCKEEYSSSEFLFTAV